MFEDDVDIDEILSTSEQTNTLKRVHTDEHDGHSSKRSKINPVTPHEPIIDTTKPTSVKKLFRFKKKANVPNETLADAGKLDVNDTISSPTKEIPPESFRNVVTEIYQNKTDGKPTYESTNFNQSKTHQRVETSIYPVNCDKISRSKSETLNCDSNNVILHIGEHSVSRIHNDRSILKRRFPGPAGLLPDRSLSNSSLENYEDSSGIETKDEICSHSSLVHFNEKLWERMMVDFKTDGISLPEKYNIQWIKCQTMTKRLINQKTPFLAAFVESIRSHSIQNPIVNLVLKDKTGTIQGTILHNLYEEHTSNLTVGSVVVLKDIGVLNMGPQDEPYLTITQNNLLSIYSDKKITVDGYSQHSDEVCRTVLQNLGAEEILNRINETKRKNELTDARKNIQSISLMNKEVTGPKHLNDTFRKAVRDVKSTSSFETPNLHVLKLKSSSATSIKESVLSPIENIKNKENIDELRELFGDNEDLDEFFNDEPVFCSTQKETFKNVDKSMETKTETCSDENREENNILEDIFEGVDANALFDEF